MENPVEKFWIRRTFFQWGRCLFLHIPHFHLRASGSASTDSEFGQANRANCRQSAYLANVVQMWLYFQEDKDVGIECNRTNLPDLKFQFGNRQYILTPEQYVLDVSACQSPIHFPKKTGGPWPARQIQKHLPSDDSADTRRFARHQGSGGTKRLVLWATLLQPILRCLWLYPIRTEDWLGLTPLKLPGLAGNENALKNSFFFPSSFLWRKQDKKWVFLSKCFLTHAPRWCDDKLISKAQAPGQDNDDRLCFVCKCNNPLKLNQFIFYGQLRTHWAGDRHRLAPSSCASRLLCCDCDECINPLEFSTLKF